MKFNVKVFKKCFENHFINNYIEKYLCEKNVSFFEKIGDEYYLDLVEDGISFNFNNKLELESISFYSDKYDEYSQFNNDLPFDLKFNFSIKNVRDILGKPDKEVSAIPSLEIEPSDIFLINDCYQLAIIYNKNFDGILFIQLAVPPII